VEGIALAVLGRANFLLLLTVIATSVTLSDDLISSQTYSLFFYYVAHTIMDKSNINGILSSPILLFKRGFANTVLFMVVFE